MKDRFEDRQERNPELPEHHGYAEAGEWDRLEQIGDLHFHASAFSSALDYYGRLLGDPVLRRLPLEQALGLLRKCIGACLNLGRPQEAEALLQRASLLLDSSRDLAPEEIGRLRALFQGRRASLLNQLGSYQQALDIAKHAFTILALTDEHTEVANLQVTMGACHQRLGRQDKAEEFYSDSLATYRRVGDELGTAALHNNLALLCKNRCRWERALDLMDKAVETANRHGATHMLSRFYLNQGIILGKISRFGEARAVLDKSLRLSRSLGDRLRQAKVCLAYGRIEIQSRRLARAEELVLEGKMLAEEGKFLRESTIADECLGDIQLARGQTDKAQFNYGIGLEKARSLGGGNDLEGELLRRSAEVQRRDDNLTEAIGTAQAAIAVCEECGEIYELGFCHLTLGHAYAAQRDWNLADSHFRESIGIFREQILAREVCQAVSEYLEVRLDSAGREELLLLRRYLLDAQEQGGAKVSDRVLCRLLHGLGRVQMRLGQFDDALLTAFELERICVGMDDDDLMASVADLRLQIETGLLGGVENAETHLRAISDLPGLFSETDASIPRNLASVLLACMERVRADSGFVAMFDLATPRSRPRVVSRENMTDNLCEQLTRWYVSQPGQDDGGLPYLFSRLNADDRLARQVPAVLAKSASSVIMPIAMHGHRFGMLYLSKDKAPRNKRRRRRNNGFSKPDLDFLATYLGFLALFLFEKSRALKPTASVATPTGEGLDSFENVITRNEKMLDVLGLARKVAPSDLTVLLNGDTGTGKGLLAYAIHALSRRASQRFLSINCAAIPDTLLESELFGHTRGSFTGADRDKPGLLMEAEKGTVFLDEIGKMSLSMQGKLLHFLDTKTVRPIGSARSLQVDVRIICASKADLKRMAAEGAFLEDLYYRLLDFPLTIPPLRQRRDDIELLTHHFVSRFSQDQGVEAPEIGPAFWEALLRHDWPGNVRELEKCLRRAMVLAQGDRVLRPEHLPPDLVSPHAPLAALEEDQVVPLKETLAAVECREIAQAMRIAQGNKSQAARLLKISYPNLLKKIRLYGITVD